MKKLVVAFLLIISILSLGMIKVNALGGSYILMDVDSGRILYARNEHERYLTASICKIMTAMVAIEQGELFHSYLVSKTATLAEGSSVYLEMNDEIYLIDLLYGLMLRSGNDAATLISEVVFDEPNDFITAMNDLAKRIGMGHSTFENPTGLDAETFNYSTAYDMALLMRYAVNNATFLNIAGQTNYRAETKKNTYWWQNKHRLLRNCDFVKAGKTGYTKRSGRTLVSYAEIADMRLVAVSFQISDDFNFHKMLFEKAAKEFVYLKVLDSGVFPQLLEKLDYYPYVKEEVCLLVKKDAKIKVHFFLEENPEEECGYLIVYENEQAILKRPIYPYRVKV